MKLSKLYSNKDTLFAPIKFQSELNVIIAEIRLPENLKKDTHNLGKTTVGKVLDFTLLSTKKPDFFLFKHLNRFADFVFFLEVEIGASSFLTIRRSVAEATKISFKRHSNQFQDFSTTTEPNWDHYDVPFERAKDLLDGILDWRTLKSWSFRNLIGYFLRTQDDYHNVFQLKKFASKHIDWKPMLAHILGFNGELIETHYKKEEQLVQKEETADLIKTELGSSPEEIGKIEGLLLLKKQEAEKRQRLLDAFDFRSYDKEKNKIIIDDLDVKIAALNAKRYSLSLSRKRILTALGEDEILFNPDDAAKIFAEVDVFFKGQIKKDFEQLIAFNKAITDERRGYLQEELTEIETELKQTNENLNSLGKKRSTALSFLGTADAFLKYKQASDEMVVLKADITTLERQKEHLHRLQQLRSEIRLLKEEKDKLQEQIEVDTQQKNGDENSLFSSIRLFFSEIVEDVMDRKALLSVLVNQKGHLDFNAEILDEAGNATSEDLGNTYRKLLCIAFDLAVIRAHLDKKFPRFVFHDGVFEALDDRKKENLLIVLRQYTNLGIQSIITLIASDLPRRSENSQPVFNDDEIILTLHDEDEQGRLFKMQSW